MRLGPDSLLYVTQWGALQKALVRFDLNGNFVDTFVVYINNALGHAWDSDTNLYISSFSEGTIKKYDPDGNFLEDFIDYGGLQGPTDIWWNDEGMAVQDWTGGSVMQFDSTGSYVSTITSAPSQPEGIAFFPDGGYLMGDWGQDAVHYIDSAGVYFGTLISGGGLADPNGVHIRENPTFSVAEADLENANIWAAGGKLYLEFSDLKSEKVEVRVMDVKGKDLVIKDFQTSGVSGTLELNLGEIADGIYIVTYLGEFEQESKKAYVGNR